EDAVNTGVVCQQDVRTARQAFQVNCPLFVLICDMETASGFREFVARFPSDQRQRRLGHRFPLLPDLANGDTLENLADRGVQWLCNALLPSRVYQLFRLEAPGREDLAAAVRGNARLY